MTSEGRVLVTGASGFIGRHLCDSFARDGRAVRALVRSAGTAPLSAAQVIVGDVEDRVSLERAVKDVDSVVHLAARVHVSKDVSSDPVAQFRRVNADGTRLLMEAALRAGASRFVLLSSVSAMTSSRLAGLSEHPDSPYGVSKLEAEEIVLNMARGTRVHAPIIRAPMVYGPRMKGNPLRLFKLIDRGIPLPLKSIRNERSLIFVGNLVAVLRVALDSPSVRAGTYGVSDSPMSAPHLALAIGRALHKRVRLVAAPPSWLRAAGRFGDILGRILPVPLTSDTVGRLTESCVVDGTAFARDGHFIPPYSTEQGLAITAAWYRSERGATAGDVGEG